MKRRDLTGINGAISDASASGGVDLAPLDLTTIDIEACRAGGFVDDLGAGMSGADAISTDGTATSN